MEVDAAVKRLIVGLKNRGLFDKVNLVVLSDHGMEDLRDWTEFIAIDDIIPPEKVSNLVVGTAAFLQPKADTGVLIILFAILISN